MQSGSSPTEGRRAIGMVGLVRGICEWDWEAAGRHCRVALDLNGNLPDNWYRYGQAHLIPVGRMKEGIEALRRASELDPMSLFVHAGLAWCYVVDRRPDDALDADRRVLRLDPLNVKARWSAAWAYQLKGLHSDAVRECETAREYAGVFPFVLAHLCRAYGLAGRHEKAQETLEQLEALAKETYTPHFCFVQAKLGLGEGNSALKHLQAAIDAREPQVFLLGAPIYDAIRHTKRFRKIVAKVGVYA